MGRLPQITSYVATSQPARQCACMFGKEWQRWGDSWTTAQKSKQLHRAPQYCHTTGPVHSSPSSRFLLSDPTPPPGVWTWELCRQESQTGAKPNGAFTSCAPHQAHALLQRPPNSTHSAASYSSFTLNFHLLAIKIDRFSHQYPVNYTQIFPAQLSPLPGTGNFFQDSAFPLPISNVGRGACCESRACTGTGNCAKTPHLSIWTAFQGASTWKHPQCQLTQQDLK